MKKVKEILGGLCALALVGFVSCGDNSVYQEPEPGNEPAENTEVGITVPVSEALKDYLRMVKVEAGSFKFKYGNDGEAEVVTLEDFAISSTEITQELYEKIMGVNPSNHSGEPIGNEIQAKRPVDSVSFYKALVFCNKLSVEDGKTPVYSVKDSTDPAEWGDIPKENNEDWNAVVEVEGATGYRLPHEKEWVFAALGDNADTFSGFDERYFSGFAGEENKDLIDEYAWYLTTKEGGEQEVGNSDKTTHQVGLKLPNSNGVYDMCGNVWELMWDKMDEETGNRVRKGAAFNQEYLGHYSVSTRWDIPAHAGWGDVGLRIVRKM